MNGDQTLSKTPLTSNIYTKILVKTYQKYYHTIAC